jgi:hypothetical protein
MQARLHHDKNLAKLVRFKEQTKHILHFSKPTNLAQLLP